MTVCFFEASTEFNLAATSPKNSLMHRLLYEKNKFKEDQEMERLTLKKDHCYVSHSMFNEVIKMMSSELVLIVSKTESISIKIYLQF